MTITKMLAEGTQFVNDKVGYVILGIIIIFFLLRRYLKARKIAIEGLPKKPEEEPEDVKIEEKGTEQDTQQLEELQKEFGKEEEEEDGDIVEVSNTQINTATEAVKKQMQTYNEKLKKSKDVLLTEETELRERNQEIKRRYDLLEKTKSKLNNHIRLTKIKEEIKEVKEE